MNAAKSSLSPKGRINFSTIRVPSVFHPWPHELAKHLGISWDVIKDIQKRRLQRRYSRPKLGKLRRIGIDEISVAKGHRYLTVVVNLDTGVVFDRCFIRGSLLWLAHLTRLARPRMKHGLNTDCRTIDPCSIRVSSVFHPWLIARGWSCLTRAPRRKAQRRASRFGADRQRKSVSVASSRTPRRTPEECQRRS